MGETLSELTRPAQQNFRLQPSFTVKLDKTFLTFTGFEGTEPMNYRVRVKTADEAQTLQKHLEDASRDA